MSRHPDLLAKGPPGVFTVSGLQAPPLVQPQQGTHLDRRRFLVSSSVGIGLGLVAPLRGRAFAAGREDVAVDLHRTWLRLILELVRHTPTFSPPVASRAFGYIGVAAFETVAGLDPALFSLAGQLRGLSKPPRPQTPAPLDAAIAVHAAYGVTVAALFANTGPTGQRALDAMVKRTAERLSEGVDQGIVLSSQAYGAGVAGHILAWADKDGGARVTNLGFPVAYAYPNDPSIWVPTSKVALQQAPLLPRWGQNRAFAMPEGDACDIGPPMRFDEAPGSAFHRAALEVYQVSKALTPEQTAIARFWSDDAMLSPTPPGHWLSIADQCLEADAAPLSRRVEVMALLGIAVADAFIACWKSKYDFNLLRPITYIRRHIDPKWEPLLNTPPFPEYPSGHSTQSAAAAAVLSGFLGNPRDFSDGTHADDGLAERSFASFDAAAQEAGISRLYGGIHYREAVERGLEQGRCVGAHVARLQTRV